MDDGRSRIERGAHVRDGLKLLVLDQNAFRGVFGRTAAAGYHSRDCFALPTHAIDCDGALRSRFQALQMREHADPWRDDRGQFLPGNDGDHAGHVLCRRRVDAHDLGMRVWRAQEHDMHHARQFDVADIETAPLHQAIEVRPRHDLADIGIRPVEHRERVSPFGSRRHAERPTRARAVDSTASTIAW